MTNNNQPRQHDFTQRLSVSEDGTERQVSQDILLDNRPKDAVERFKLSLGRFLMLPSTFGYLVTDVISWVATTALTSNALIFGCKVLYTANATTAFLPVTLAFTVILGLLWGMFELGKEYLPKQVIFIRLFLLTVGIILGIGG